MKAYCPTCGSGTSYAATKPKFCSSCGKAFSALNKTPAKRVFKADPRNPVATIQEEVEEEEFEMPDMNKLDRQTASKQQYYPSWQQQSAG